MWQVTPQGMGASGFAQARAKTKPTILIADDSRDGCEMMQTLLGLNGYEVVSAQNGPAAVQLALAAQPDLILLDLQLPGLDGLGVTRSLRSHPEFRDTPIIIISGHDPLDHRQPALEAGCTDYLLKPIDFGLLDMILKAEVPLNPS